MCTRPGGISSFGDLRATSSRREIAARVAAGTLEQLRIGVYAHVGLCAPMRTAALHGGGVACVTAARHHGLWVLTEEEHVHVWVGEHGRTREHGECTCVTHWEDAATTAFGVPPVRTVLRQILGCRGIEEFFVTLESALRQGKLTKTDVAWLRRHTNDLARDAIDFARDDADSGLESLLRWRLRRHGLPVRAQVHIFSVGVVDFLIGDRLLIETDGKANHASVSHRHKDLERDALAMMWGYTTLRFDYAMIIHDWEIVELAILAALDRNLHRDARA